VKRTKKPAAGKRRYSVGGVITISVHTEVEAASPEEAREIAINDRGIMSLCHQCASGDPSLEWVTSGEFDCDVPSPYEEGGELEAIDLDAEDK
jgi:hypothetical protein